jgi:hypothetical protein
VSPPCSASGAKRRERRGKGRARVCAAGAERWLATALMGAGPRVEPGAMLVHGPRERMGLWQLRRRNSKQPDVLLWMALRVGMQLDVQAPAPSGREPMRPRFQPAISRATSMPPATSRDARQQRLRLMCIQRRRGAADRGSIRRRRLRPAPSAGLPSWRRRPGAAWLLRRPTAVRPRPLPRQQPRTRGALGLRNARRPPGGAIGALTGEGRSRGRPHPVRERRRPRYVRLTSPHDASSIGVGSLSVTTQAPGPQVATPICVPNAVMMQRYGSMSAWSSRPSGSVDCA